MTFIKGQSGNPTGRPARAEKFARPIARAEKRIADRLPELIDRAFELAQGVLIEEEDRKTGEKNVYACPPDRQAIEYLLNRIMGKPTERQETEHTGDLTIRVEYSDLDPAEAASSAADPLT